MKKKIKVTLYFSNLAVPNLGKQPAVFDGRFFMYLFFHPRHPEINSTTRPINFLKPKFLRTPGGYFKF